MDIQLNNKIWLHRNNHTGRGAAIAWKALGFTDGINYNKSKKNTYISIGCNSRKLTKEDYIEIKSKEDEKSKWNAFENVMERMFEGNKPRYRYFLWRFLFEFKQGNYLLIPGNNQDFHVFKIISSDIMTIDEVIKEEPNIEKNDNIDFHYFWKVSYVETNISRKKRADSDLSSRMKIYGSTYNITDLKNNLENALNTKDHLSPRNDAINSVKETLMKSLQNSLDSNKFEKLIKWYFDKKGADSAIILPKNVPGEKDSDVEATFEAFKLKIYVQAKNHKEKVDLETACRQIAAYKNDREEEQQDNSHYTNLYWVIYSSLEEQPIEDENIKKYESEGIRIISGNEFAEMILDVGLDKLDDAFYD